MKKDVSDINLFTIINGFERNGKVHISSFVKSQFNSLKDEFLNSELIIIQNNTDPISILGNIRNTRSKIKSNSIIHAQYGTVTALISVLAKKGNPLIISFCGDDILGSARNTFRWQIRGLLGKKLSIFSCFFAKIIIAKSKNIANSIPKRFHNKVHIIPNGVERDVFYPTDKNEAQKQLGWDSEWKYVLFNPSRGNNTFIKNLPLAIEVIENLKEKGYKIKLVQIKNKTSTEINVMMNASDSLLVTSYREGSPNIVKEAMACDLPVVSVKCGDVKERLKKVKNSYVTSSYDSGEIEKFLEQILKDEVRSNGSKVLEEDGLYADQVKTRIMSLYNDII